MSAPCNFGDRGILVVFEGGDGCGKTTLQKEVARQITTEQPCRKLVTLSFPDRSSEAGSLCDRILRNTVKTMTPWSRHLIFSADRWEAQPRIVQLLDEGHLILCDRYAHSGVAYTVSPEVSMTWALGPDTGLPNPNLIVFVDCDPTIALERHRLKEVRREIFDGLEAQNRVLNAYKELEKADPRAWYHVSSTDDLEQNAKKIVAKINELVPMECGVLWGKPQRGIGYP